LPVPSSTTVFRTSVTLSATFSVKAGLGAALCFHFVAPSYSTDLTENGSFCFPLAANVAYAPAMRIELGSEIPMEKDGKVVPVRLLGLRPAFSAASFTLSRPTSIPSCTKAEFAETLMASRRSIR
jgi:hypothetical protein